MRCVSWPASVTSRTPGTPFSAGTTVCWSASPNASWSPLVPALSAMAGRSPAPPDATLTSVSEGKLGFSDSAALRMVRSVSSSSSPKVHSTSTCALPLDVVEVTLVTPGTARTACSSGSVTLLAISSGARPCDCAEMNAIGACSEGISSCLREPIDIRPRTTTASVARERIRRFLRLLRVRNDMER